MLGWKSAEVCLEDVLLLSVSLDDGLSSSGFLTLQVLIAGITRLSLFCLISCTAKAVSVMVAWAEFVEVVALGSNVAAGGGIGGLAEDEFITGLGVVDAEGEAAVVETGVGVISSAFGADSTLVSTLFAALIALGLSLAILERSSVCDPLTALETVSRVFLTRDICWLRPADQREAEVFKYRVLV